MKSFRLIFALSLIPALLPAQSGDAILDRAVASYSRLKSMRAEFRQTLTNPLTGSTSSSTGVLLRRKPNLLDISFDSGDRIVADGSSVWLYAPTSVPGQVIRASARAAASGTFDPAGELLVSPKSKYAVSSAVAANVNGRAAHLITLAPKANAQFASVKLWVDDSDASVRRLEVTDANGLTRSIVITRFTPNATFPRGAFTFTPPKGVRVVNGPLQQLN